MEVDEQPAQEVSAFSDVESADEEPAELSMKEEAALSLALIASSRASKPKTSRNPTPTIDLGTEPDSRSSAEDWLLHMATEEYAVLHE